MLTKVTVSGYKSLQRSSARLAPFTVIVGRNNVGKSNLFDALRLLSHLAQMPVASAFKPERHRGDPVESFFSEQESSLRIECDFELDNAPHPFDADERLSNPFLHYEICITFHDGLLRVQSESLKGRTQKTTRLRPYITTGQDEHDQQRVSINRDAAKAGRTRHFRSPAARSVLTMIDDAELYPHVVALADELSAWRFFHFDPEALREPSPAMDILELEPSGRGLSGFYDTLEKKERPLFESAERALHKRGISEAQNIRVLDTGDRRRLLAIARQDGREFTARILSDGTLRFLALLALAYAPQPPSLVCFEEPENGVHPGQLPFIVDTLRSITARRATGGRRSQVLVNSHSPYLVDLLDPEEMLVASPGNEGQTHFASVTQDLFRNRPRLKELLESGDRTLGEAWSEGYLDGNA